MIPFVKGSEAVQGELESSKDSLPRACWEAAERDPELALELAVTLVQKERQEQAAGSVSTPAEGTRGVGQKA